jgi:hypothetical protein
MNDIKNLRVDKNGYLKEGKWRVDPFNYTIRNIPWKWFLSFHFKDSDYRVDSEFAGKNRRKLINDIIQFTRKKLGLASNDLHYFMSDEKQQGRVHTQGVITKKDKVIVEDMEILMALRSNIPLPEVSCIERGKEYILIEPVRDSKRAAAYLNKFNKNDFKDHRNFMSSKFVEFANNYRQHAFRIPDLDSSEFQKADP